MSYAFGDFEVEVSSFELRERGAIVQVQPKALAVLVYLLRNRERVVSQKELLDAVWSGVNVSPNSLAQAIASVRRQLHDPGEEIIRTVHSRGYRFVASVEQHHDVLPTRDALTDTPFVGRAESLKRLRLRLDEARDGRGDISLVTGPPGIGKTRMADEIARIAAARGTDVRRGRWYEEGVVQPLALWREIMKADGDLLAVSSGTEADPLLAFERVRSWLQNGSRRHPPLLVVLEDMNWADAPSLLLLKFLARDIRMMPVHILATYRDTPISPPLARVLGAICREDPKRRIELDRLDLAATSELAKELVGSQVSPELIENLWRKSDGNPLFLTQMLHVVAMENISGPISRLTSTLLGPETVREAITAHLDPLSAACCEILMVAAVLGLRFRLDLLAQTMHVEPLSLVERLDEGCKARIVAQVAGSTGAFQFHHGVVRDVLYRRLSLLDKTKWHWAAGDASAHFYDAGHIDDPLIAAEHWVHGAAAGDVDAAVAWLTRTSRSIWSSDSRRAAVALVEKALELAAPSAVTSKTSLALQGVVSDIANDAPDDPRVKAIVEKFQRRAPTG